ncbi:MAG: hypothetical protein GY754_19220 [bacterium]|nr:hypothetical protein [bacterium]
MNYTNVLILLPVYSFVGWCIEFVYRTVYYRKPVNPGLLKGPFLPLYGTSALVLIEMSILFRDLSVPARILLFAAAISVIEYTVGFLTEKFYGIKLWDYDDERFNIHGRVCLKYSLLWGCLSFVFIRAIHPLTTEALGTVPHELLMGGTYVLLGTMAVDAAASTISMKRFAGRLRHLSEVFHTLTEREFSLLLKHIKRQQYAFGILRNRVETIISTNLKENLNTRIASLVETMEQEYNDIAADILNNEEFLLLKNYYHHNSSIYDHVKKVSYVAYRLCKYLGLDYRSAARGALLHDFFLYDWRKDEGRPYEGGLHGFKHSRVALNNAEKHFELNAIEKDVIIKHMWPLTIALPRFRESFVVTFIDKYISSSEFISEVKNAGMNKLRKRKAA